MKWTLYNTGTGEFGPVVTAPHWEDMTPHLRDGVAAKEGGWKRKSNRVDLATGDIVAKTPN